MERKNFTSDTRRARVWKLAVIVAIVCGACSSTSYYKSEEVKAADSFSNDSSQFVTLTDAVRSFVNYYQCTQGKDDYEPQRYKIYRMIRLAEKIW